MCVCVSRTGDDGHRRRGRDSEEEAGKLQKMAERERKDRTSWR